jgi:membrane-bound lytic murein transglycosylase B
MKTTLSRRAALAGSVALAAAPAAAAPTEFQAWVRGLRAEALQKGISARTFDVAFQGVAPQPKILELDRRQPEVVQSLEQYLASRLTPTKIENGRRRRADNGALLARVQERFGVPPQIVVALWGLESDYGRFMGDFSVVGSLATLAFDGRRAAYFRDELLEALRILERGRLAVGELRGSWAGAMGQCQFMPSNYLRLAVDFDGDGVADIWNSLPDVFASAANKLAKDGWRAGEGWGREVRLPAGFDEALIDPNGAGPRKPVGEWRALGGRAPGGERLDGDGAEAWLSRPDGPGTRAFLVHGNFAVLRRWNSPQRFRIAVGLLADRIAAA